MLTLRPGYVSDPVHEFIPFTGLERRIIDHMVTQRLRRISQTGLSSYIYPELVSSRFGHCLGAMHLASAFLAATFRNSDADTLEGLVVGISQAVREAQPNYNKQFPRNDLQPPPLDGAAQESNSNQTLQVYRLYNPPAGLDPTEFENRRRSLIIAEQALRLASLFHDLGHLPFSHNFEDALQEMHDDAGLPAELEKRISAIERGREKEKLHEVLGLEIGHLALRSFLAQQDSAEAWSAFEETTYTLIYDLWEAKSPWEYARTSDEEIGGATASRNWLKSLISGQIDVDRADYILRDGRNYGFDFASFNLERLLGQFRVVQQDDGAFVLATKPQGVGFLESFILARHRSYQYGVLHHKATQVATALQTVIRDSLVSAFGNVDYTAQSDMEITEPSDDPGGHQEANLDLLERLGESLDVAHRQQLVRFIDDIAWLLNYGRRRRERRITGRPLDGEAAATFDPMLLFTDETEHAILRRFSEYDDYWFTSVLRELDRKASDPWAQLVWWRRPVARSLWKRPRDFTVALLEAQNEFHTLPHDLRGWNDRLNEFVRVGEAENHVLWGATLSRLRQEHGVLVSYRQIAPLDMVEKEGRSVSEGLLVEAVDGLHYLTDVSPLAMALASAWQEDLHLRAFVVSITPDGKPAPMEEAELHAKGVVVIKELWRVLDASRPGKSPAIRMQDAK